jgi:type I restriction enzyme R subunit
MVAELDRLKAELAAIQSETERLKSHAIAAEAELRSAAELAAAEREERGVWEALAKEADKGRSALADQLQAAFAFSKGVNSPAPELVAELARDAADRIVLDEMDIGAHQSGTRRSKSARKIARLVNSSER